MPKSLKIFEQYIKIVIRGHLSSDYDFIIMVQQMKCVTLDCQRRLLRFKNQETKLRISVFEKT
jgi:hypothetical protein